MSVNRIPVILPIEVKNRELDSKLLLALHLVYDGFPVVVGSKGGCARELKFLSKSIYLAKSLSIDYLETFKTIKKNGGKILVLFEEGAAVFRKEDKFEEIKSFYPETMLSFVDLIFTYGSSYRQLLMNNFKILDYTNTFVSGNTRFDLHKPKYKEYFSDRVRALRKKYGKYILFNGNFNLANHFISQEYLINELSNNKDWSKKLISKYLGRIDKKKKNLQKFITMIEEVAKIFKEYTLIVRPHPGEKLDIYIKKFKDIRNIFVSNKYVAIPWILGAEIVIHQDCTTAIEAFFAGKPIISYLPFKEDLDVSWIPVYISEKSRNESEVINKITEYLGKNKKYELSDEKRSVLRNEIINVVDETSTLLIKKMKEIEESIHKDDNEYTSSQKRPINYFYRIYKRKRNYLGWYRRKYLRKEDNYSRNFKGLSKREVKIILNKFKKIENMNFEFDIKRLGINTFLIRKIGQ